MPGAVSHDASALDVQVVRRLTPELQWQVDRLADAAEAVDGLRPFGEHKWLRLVRGDDRCAALLVRRGERLVGAAHCDAYHTSAPERPCRLTAELVVHPELRNQGIGRRLLAAIVDHAEEEVAQELHLWAYGNLEAAQHLAHACNFAPERTLLQYVLPAEDLPSSTALRTRPFDRQRDVERWLQLHNRVFAGHPEQGAWDRVDLEARLAQPWFDSADLLMAADDSSGDVLGFCWVKLPRDAHQPGEIYIVGVDPKARGQRLGKELTRAGLVHIRQANRPGAMLYVEADNTPAIKLYESLGFEQRFEHVCYGRRV
ncbi:MAG TPA: mycothiol synthase [Chloroflexota bacterium]